ncbi:MAG TPA: hypothetical protein VF832_05205 [Longimicrobiales bacterium]
MIIQGPPDPAIIAPMVVSIVFFVTTAAVLIFRPLTKRLGDRLANSNQPPPPALDTAELVHLRHALEETSARVELLEQRLDFTERLLSSPRASAATPLPPSATQQAPGALPPRG